MDSFVFAPRNAAHCISGQNKWLETRGLLGMYAEDWTKCEKLARRTTASAPHNASVIGDPAEHWTDSGRQVPQYNWGLMDKETARSYLEAWIREPMMKPRKVV